jgi:hypothetical protein
MGKQKLLEINGKRYMLTSEAAKMWGIKPATVSLYCRDGMIPDSFKNVDNNWWIPVSAIRPLSKAQIKKILLLTIQLTYNLTYQMDYRAYGVNIEGIKLVYNHLAKLGYIRKLDKDINATRIPYEAKLTQKGIEIVASAADDKSNNLDIVAKEWASIILDTAVAIIKALA